MRPIIPLALALLLVSCARSTASRSTDGVTQAGRRCVGSVDERLLAQGPVYRACEVDRMAKIVGQPRVVYEPSRSTRDCMSAEIEFVVDEQGIPVPGLFRVVRTNDSQYAAAVAQSYPSFRYAPALKDGRPVRQIVSFGSAIMARVTVVSSSGGPPSSPPPPPPRRARC